MGLKEHVPSRFRKKDKLAERLAQDNLDMEFFAKSIDRTASTYMRATEFLDRTDRDTNHPFDLANIALCLALLDAEARIGETRKPDVEKKTRTDMAKSLRRMYYLNLLIMITPEEAEVLRNPITLNSYEGEALSAAQAIFDHRGKTKEEVEGKMKHVLPRHITMLRYYRTRKST